MIDDWIYSLQQFNLITAGLLFIWFGSIIQGLVSGASKTAGRLFTLVSGGVLTVISIAGAIPLTIWLSPRIQQWIDQVTLPARELNKWEQIYYTLLTGVRDFSLIRFAVVFFISYVAIRFIAGLIAMLTVGGNSFVSRLVFGREKRATLFSRLVGAGIGAVIGAARCLIVIVILFIMVSLFPSSEFSKYIEASPVYQQGTQSVIEPISGSLIKEQLPVFTRNVEAELKGILQRKYEIIDAQIPSDIELAAATITKGAASEEEKARLLYEWVGSRVSYDDDKVRDYEERNIWHEQTPQDTFDTKKGVCIDYSRLYAVMARSQGLQVKVVTGLGYDGQGGYGPHAWNEVYLTELDKWVPLDATWARSGDWFDPPAFAETHIPNA